MVADTRVETNTFDNLTCIQTQTFCIAIQFVKVRHAHRQIGISEKFNRFCFSGVGKQGRDILLNRAFL